MTATCSNIAEPRIEPSTEDNQRPLQDRTDNFLYQAAIVLAILLFLATF